MEEKVCLDPPPPTPHYPKLWLFPKNVRADIGFAQYSHKTIHHDVSFGFSTLCPSPWERLGGAEMV